MTTQTSTPLAEKGGINHGDEQLSTEMRVPLWDVNGVHQPAEPRLISLWTWHQVCKFKGNGDLNALLIYSGAYSTALMSWRVFFKKLDERGKWWLISARLQDFDISGCCKTSW